MEQSFNACFIPDAQRIGRASIVGVSASRLSAVRAATHSLTERRAVRNPSLIIASCDLPSAMVPLLNALLAFAQSAEPFDCETQVKPVDIVPIRSAQSVHAALTRRFAGRSIVEIGTRNGDGMECFARVSSRAVAIEIDSKYCPTLRTRSSTMHKLGLGNFSVLCESYLTVPFAVFEAADYITGFMGDVDTDVKILKFLAKESERLFPRAEALLVFDQDEPMDKVALKLLTPLAAWSEEVAASPLECKRCHQAMALGYGVAPALLQERPHPFVSCSRARMKMTILGFRVQSEGGKLYKDLAALGSALDGHSSLHHAYREGVNARKRYASGMRFRANSSNAMECKEA